MVTSILAVLPDGVDEGVKNEFNKGEDTKDHPVPQPGPRMLWRAMEDRLEGGKGRVADTHQGSGHQSHKIHGFCQECEGWEGRRISTQSEIFNEMKTRS